MSFDRAIPSPLSLRDLPVIFCPQQADESVYHALTLPHRLEAAISPEKTGWLTEPSFPDFELVSPGAESLNLVLGYVAKPLRRWVVRRDDPRTWVVHAGKANPVR